VSDTCQLGQQLSIAKEPIYLPRLAPVIYGTRCDFPVDPYVLGVMIGDGSLTKQTKVHTLDTEILNELSRLESLEFRQVREDAYCLIGPAASRIVDVLGKSTCYTKRIPKEYMVGSLSQRLSLLQGLMDTDGSCSKKQGTAYFSTVNKGLADDVCDLIRSLGGFARAREHPGQYYSYKGERRRGSPFYAVAVRIDMCPFRLSRKARRWRIPKTNRHRSKAVAFVRETGEQEKCVCIQVDSNDGLYVTSGYTLTHNTSMMAGLAGRWPVGRVMLMSHRFELNVQAMAEFERVAGCDCDLEQASYEADQRANKSHVVVASVQTLNSRRRGKYRMEKFYPPEFGLLLIDEAHRSLATTYRRVIRYFRERNPSLCLVGVTATPDRLDGQGMGKVYDDVICDYNLTWAIEQGWLVAPVQKFVRVNGLDLRSVRTVAGDLHNKQLQEIVEQERVLHSMAKPMVDVCGASKQSIVFTASVRQAHRLAELIRDYHQEVHGHSHQNTAVAIDGTWSPQDSRRKAVIKAFKAGEIQHLVNCGVACLDDKTEVLTDSGWVGHDRITHGHKIANWDQGVIHFAEPLAIEVRNRRDDEQMVVLETINMSIRVTDGHRVLYRTYQQGKFMVCRARDMVSKKAEVPICGYSEPLLLDCGEGVKTKASFGRRVAANSYHLRKAGMSPQEARVEAMRRIGRRQSLSRRSPQDLSVDECKFIGFWLGDGSCNRLQRGGVEYTLSQSTAYPNICEWVDCVLKALGVDFVRRDVKVHGSLRSPALTWSIPRGTGFGQQARNGLYHLEEYLNKDGSKLLWGLDQEQFDALLLGLWYADGDHGDAERPPANRRFRIFNTNKGLLDLLQAVAVCRGYRASITDGKSNASKNPSHAPLWRLSLSYRGPMGSHAMTKYRMEMEEGWKPETVWCVKSDTGFIVTRRRGTVTVTGNTEGFDVPAVKVIGMGRPTKSRGLYVQCIGRGSRPIPGTVDGPETPAERRAAIAASAKPHCTVIDFVGQAGRHSLVSTIDVLAGEAPDQEVIDTAKSYAARKDYDKSAIEALDEAREAVRLEREAKRARVTVDVDYDLIDAGSLYSMAQIPTVRVPGYLQNVGPTEKQRSMLQKLGYNAAQIDQLNTRTASSAIDYAIRHPRNGFGRWLKKKKGEELK